MNKPSAHSLISTLSALFLLTSHSTAGEPKPAAEFAPRFYAFENGLGTLPTDGRIALLKELGYHGIGSARPNDLPDLFEKYHAAGLEILSLYLGGKLGTGDAPHTFDPGMAEAIRHAKGHRTVIELYVQGDSKNTDAQAVAFVQEIADLAKASDLNVVLYPHAGFYIDTLSAAVRIAKLSGRDNVGAMFNLCHYLKVEPGSDLRATLESAGDLLRRASICGADPDGKSWPELIQPLDSGTFDQKSLLTILRDLNFKGDIGLQCYNIKSPPADHLKKSITAWNKIQP